MERRRRSIGLAEVFLILGLLATVPCRLSALSVTVNDVECVYEFVLYEGDTVSGNFVVVDHDIFWNSDHPGIDLVVTGTRTVRYQAILINRPSAVDFDCRRPIEEEIDSRWSIEREIDRRRSIEEEKGKKKKKRKRRKKEEEKKEYLVRVPSSPVPAVSSMRC
ncbi:hypothetical protein GW17_00027024 [Ensete ventricosum]|nr:hypothetical protein GW17_00027024 [Ensete ventricosum]